MQINELITASLKAGGLALCIGAMAYVLLLLSSRYRHKFTLSEHILRFLFFSYFCLLFILVFAPLNENRFVSQNIIPGSSIYLAIYNRNTADAFGLISNIILFVPMGLLFPYLVPKINKLWKISILAAGISLVIECIQLGFPSLGRAFDVDDIICNTAGAMIGFFLFIFFIARLFKNKLRTSLSIPTYVTTAVAVLLLMIGIGIGCEMFVNTSHGRLNIINIGNTLKCEINFPAFQFEKSVPIYIASSYEELMTNLQAHFGLSAESEVDPLGKTFRTNRNCRGTKSKDEFQLIVNIYDNSWIADIRLENKWDISSRDSITDEVAAFLEFYNFENIDIGNITIDSQDSVTIECKNSVRFLENEKMQISYIYDGYPHLDINSNINTYDAYSKVFLKSPEEALKSRYICSITSNDSGPETSYDLRIRNPEKVDIKSIQLIYLHDNVTKQILPAWKYIGLAYDKNEIERIYVIAPAVL